MARESSSELKDMAKKLLAMTGAKKYVALRVKEKDGVMTIRLVVDNVRSEKRVFTE